MGRARLTILGLLCVVASCATPSRREMNKQADEARRIMSARAVHMPPAGVDSCVGVTVRLSDGSPGHEEERKELAGRITDEEVERAIDAAGVETCREAYLEGIEQGGITPEPLQIRYAYGVDPDGRVCSIVERARADPIDPAAAPLFEAGAECLKEVLFRARFPEGRVKDRERVIRFYSLSADPTETVRPE